MRKASKILGFRFSFGQIFLYKLGKYLMKIIGIFFVIFVFSGCKLNYSMSTCGFHKHGFTLNFHKNVIYLRDFTVYAKDGKNAEEIIFLSKNNYCLYYYHCQDLVDGTAEVFSENSETALCSLYFGSGKRGVEYFSADKKASYKIIVKSQTKRQIHFCLAIVLKNKN